MFAALQSHHLFEDHFGRPGKGNDKGKVEGMVGYGRRTFMVPMPRAHDFDELNEMLRERCEARQAAVLRGSEATIGERLARDRAVLLELPAAPFHVCDMRPARVSCQAPAPYRNVDCSVPSPTRITTPR